MGTPRVHLIRYSEASLEERSISSVDELGTPSPGEITWVNVDGSEDPELVRAVGQHYGLHPLAIEDVLAHHERAKVDTYDAHDFVVIRMLELDKTLRTEQLSMVLGRDLVITFQEHAGGDPFDDVRAELRHGRKPLRSGGADQLVYELLDAVVDAYFPVLERYGDKLDDLEEEAVEHPRTATLSAVHALKRDLLRIRRAVWPLREALSTLGRSETPFVKPETRLYLRDLHDRTIQVMDLIETYRDLGSALTDLYLSSVSNRLNEVMKVLTIISTIFIPLSFIAGVYGMNFDHTASRWNMPELGWRYGYPYALGVMAAVAAGMVVYFWRKGWLRRS